MDQVDIGIVFFFGIVAALTTLGVLLRRGDAKPGVVAIIIALPFVFLFGIPLLGGEMPTGVGDFSSTLVIGILGSIIAGLILMGIRKK